MASAKPHTFPAWKRAWTTATWWWWKQPVHHLHRSPANLFIRLLRDLFMLVVGVLGIVQAPPSIEAFSDRSTLITSIWAAMFVVGTLCSAWGIVRDRPMPEIAGCCLIAAAFAMWGFAALLGPEVTVTTVQIACVFGSGATAQLYRCFVIVGEGEGRRLT